MIQNADLINRPQTPGKADSSSKNIPTLMQRITNIVHQTSELIRLTNTLIHFYKQAQLDLNKLFQAI